MLCDVGSVGSSPASGERRAGWVVVAQSAAKLSQDHRHLSLSLSLSLHDPVHQSEPRSQWSITGQVRTTGGTSLIPVISMIYPGVTVSSSTSSSQGMMLAEGLASLGQQTPSAYSHNGAGGHILENKVSTRTLWHSDTLWRLTAAFITRQRAWRRCA